MGERLSKIETVPDAAVADVQWAFDQIIERRGTQQTILDELNSRVRQLGLEPFSASTFNRWVLRVREGAVRRPQSRATRSTSTAVFDPVFRDRLIQSIGVLAVGQMELTMTALTNRGDA